MSSRSTIPAALVAALLSVASVGCYSYAPVQDGPVDAGQNVRLTVEEAGDQEPALYTGRLQRIQPDTFVLEVPVARTPGQAASADDRRRLLRIPSDRVRQVERESFSLWRTFGLVGSGGVAGYFVLAELAGSTENREPGGGDEDTGDFAVIIPLLQLP